MNRSQMNKLGQVTVFIIIAIVIVVVIVIFFSIRGGLFASSIPAEFRPVYNFYSECIEQESKNALDILGTQGGKIDTGEFIPGSEYAPFSSHLNFLGIPVPYWYYVSGNNLIKENTPSKKDMEEEVSVFLGDRVNDCDFSSFYEQGFWIDLSEEARVEVDIKDDEVVVVVNSDIIVSREDRSARKTKHEIVIDSKVGKFYDIAKDIYNKQKDEAFLEEYAVDVLRLYAPVDGVEVQCNPKIWKTREVVDDLKNGLEANIGAIKFRGNYYRLDDSDDEYFVVDLGVKESVRLLYSKDWPTKIEIFGEGVDEEIMISEPVGLQEGLGILGFCYVPYHFVYDVSFPVLVQISDGFEIFQFPITVIIDNNLPREADLMSLEEGVSSEVCQFKEGDVAVYTFDTALNPVEADVSYECFDSVCSLGKTEISGNEAVLDAKIPLCINGQLIVKAEGFAEKKQFFSSNSESVADVILDREYEVEVELRIAGREVTDDTAIVHFSGEEGVVSAVLPESNEVSLKEGLYDIEVFVYGDSNVVIPSSRKVECYEVARGGLFGLFGSTKEECVDVEIPELRIEYALTGGGKTTSYILESELSEGKVIIDVSELPRPDSLEQLQYNYEIFNSLGVQLTFV